MACPYFVPREIVYDISWPHPARLPLGAGWTGTCCAHDEQGPTGSTGSEAFTPVDPALIRDFCNLGYATACPHLPNSRDWDAVRFSIAGSAPNQITISYICEFAHAPKAHGMLTYDLVAEAWREPDLRNDARVRRLAGSFLHAYRLRQSVPPLDLSVAD